MPTVRAIVRDAAQHDYRFSAVVLGIANSPAFRMKVAQDAAAAATTTASVESPH